MKMHAIRLRRSWSTVVLATVGALCAGAPAASAHAPAPAALARTQDRGDLLRYVRAAQGGAKAYNLNDPQAVVVLDVDPDTVLAVHGERNGWLDVEAPGGFQVWVWGAYLEPSSDFGVLQVTGDSVRMRPLPSSDLESYPLNQLLGRGQKVRMIQRKDESLPLAKDWVKIWSPAGARAWVPAADTVPLGSGQSGPAAWAAAVTSALDARRLAKPAEAGAPTGGNASSGAKGADEATTSGKGAPAQQVAQALAAADEKLAAERRKEQENGVPDYATVLDAYRAVLALEPRGPTAEVVTSRMNSVSAWAEAYRLREDLEAERVERNNRKNQVMQDIESAKDRDPFDRFDARGWIVQRTLPGEKQPIWVLEWSGNQVAEVVCLSGRYDLSVFQEFEVGINGRVLRGAVPAAAGAPARAQEIDIARIEVLSGRMTRLR